MDNQHPGRNAPLCHSGGAKAPSVVSRGPNMTHKKKGSPKAALEVTNSYPTPDDTPSAPEPQRSAENWFLDAFCYARDGLASEACTAALRGICALRSRYGR